MIGKQRCVLRKACLLLISGCRLETTGKIHVRRLAYLAQVGCWPRIAKGILRRSTLQRRPRTTESRDHLEPVAWMFSVRCDYPRARRVQPAALAKSGKKSECVRKNRLTLHSLFNVGRRTRVATLRRQGRYRVERAAALSQSSWSKSADPTSRSVNSRKSPGPIPAGELLLSR
jgi:hypothetical protein